jgi:DNA-binding LytR/AlgR family response regulator
MKTKKGGLRKKHQELIENASINTIMLKAKLNYTLFIFKSGTPILMSYTLAVYGHLLQKSFIRVNRSCIVNKSCIKNLDFGSKVITLIDGTECQISRRRWDFIAENVA